MEHLNDYVVIKAKEDGVNVIGLTRGKDTRFHHSEKLDKQIGRASCRERV